MPALWGFGVTSGSIVGWGYISSTPASAGGPVLKTRKDYTTKTPPAITKVSFVRTHRPKRVD